MPRPQTDVSPAPVEKILAFYFIFLQFGWWMPTGLRSVRCYFIRHDPCGVTAKVVWNRPAHPPNACAPPRCISAQNAIYQ